MRNAADRHRALARIHAVQAQKKRLEDWRLADLRRRERDAAQAEADLIAALGEGSAFHGLFVDQAARRLGLLAGKRRTLADASQAQAQAALAQARRAEAAEKLVAEAARRAEEERRREADLDALETLLARAAADASLA